MNFFSAFIVPDSARRDVERMAFQREQERKLAGEDEVKEAIKRWDAEHGRGALGTIHTLIDHIEHIIQVAGVDHVGIGSDYDGINRTPIGLEDVSCYPAITQELLSRGYDQKAIHKILGGNVMRALRQAESVAKKLQSPPAKE